MSLNGCYPLFLLFSLLTPVGAAALGVSGVYTGNEPLLLGGDNDACTTVVMGKQAGIHGPMVSHNMDCFNCDFRVNKVPAMDWPEGSKRDIVGFRSDYPIQITEDRGKTWKKDNLQGTHDQLKAWEAKDFLPPTGSIPQVKHTYALLEGGYGMMNEFGLSMGESTCQAKFWNAPVGSGGKGVIEVSQMSKIALERTTNARDAIQVMGDLATGLGYYSCAYSGGTEEAYLGEGGEALTIVDPNESWIFHVLPDDTGTSAVWVAQRVPDNHVSAVANQFVIRQVDPNSTDFMFSTNMWDVAKRNGFWDESMGLLDFAPTFSPQRAHSYYCTRRVWRVFSLANPSWGAAEDGSCSDSWCSQFPFSVEVERKMTPGDVMTIMRDHYEGTAYDMTKGVAAGPYGNPNRWDASNQVFPMTTNQYLNGSYERSISIFRTSTSIIAEPRAGMPSAIGNRLWFSQYAPSAAAYTPIYVTSDSLPKEFTTGSLYKYDDDCAFWNFALAANYAYNFYEFAIGPIKALQASYESEVNKKVAEMEKEALKVYSDMEKEDNSTSKHASKDAGKDEKDLVKALNKFSQDEAKEMVSSWKSMFKELVVLYHDGYIASNLTTPDLGITKIFYPYWWLKISGYVGSAVNPYWENDDILEFAPNPSSSSPSFSSLPLLLITAALSVLVGFAVGSRAKADGGVRSDLVAPWASSRDRHSYQVVPDDFHIQLSSRSLSNA